MHSVRERSSPPLIPHHSHAPHSPQLPCAHVYCGGCLVELRKRPVHQSCPLCRAELPPDLDSLHNLGARAYKRILGRVRRREVSWAALPAAQQEEVGEVVAMLREAADQGHLDAQALLAQMYEYGQGVAQDIERAMAL